jgi:spore maturation protein CgeB
LLKRATRDTRAARRARPAHAETLTDRVQRALANGVTKPRWQRHLANLLDQHRDTDAVLFLTVPPSHFVGVPSYLLSRFGVPTYFYDGDAPASLPSFAGFQTGFRIYEGVDLGEYAGVISSSLGAVDELQKMGARDVQVVHYAADPALFAPLQLEQDLDVFFYGHGAEYREAWVEAMLTKPSSALPEAVFAVRGSGLGDVGRAKFLPYLSFSKLREYCCRSRINLLITRQAHASVYASSNARPFELAALGCAMVSNPYLGVEQWFEPGHEILIVGSAQEAIETYRRLLRDQGTRRELGLRARRRLLAQHTYLHRADELVAFLSGQPTRRPSSYTTEDDAGRRLCGKGGTDARGD